HSLWVLIAVATGGAWIFYFADAPTLLSDLFTGDAAYAAYATIAILTATTYIFGGLMREQVCTYMCPWPRIQGAMLDADSLTVTYNDWRGEPRSRHAKKARVAGQSVGDCVDCNACVAVCPLGIDIRDGQQMECITCAICIDACDNVMTKIGLEGGLISYTTLRDYNANMALATGGNVSAGTGTTAEIAASIEPQRVRGEASTLGPEFLRTTLSSIIRPRTLIYFGIWSAIGLAMVVALLLRDRVDMNVIQDRNPVFVQLSDGSIRNGYTVKLLNMKPELRSFTLSIQGLPRASMTLAGSESAPTKQLAFAVNPNELRAVRVFVRTPRSDLSASETNFDFVLKEIDGDETDRYAARFGAPESRP
ncbi:MAG: cytochrome c oxidase accessory protein CcoG, partial [Pseudomonadota bacterium]